MLDLHEDPNGEGVGRAGDFPRFHRLSMLHAVWTRWRLLLGIWLALTAVVAVVVTAIPPTYRAEAIVLVDSQKIPESFVSSTVNGELADRLALISQNIMTSTRLLEIVASFDLYHDQRTRLTQEELLRKMRTDITVAFEKSWTGGRMQAFRLAYEGPDASVVTNVANRLAGLYVAENARTREDQAEETVGFLSRQLGDAKKSLDEQEQKVAQFKQEHNGSLPEQETSLLATLNNYNVELQGTQAALVRAQENKLSMSAALSAAQSSEALLRASLGSASRVGASDAGHADLPQSQVLADRLQALRARYTPEHPYIQEAERQLSEAEASEARLRTAVRAASPPGDNNPSEVANPRTGLPSTDLLQSRERVATLRSQLEVAQHQIDALERQRRETLASIAQCEARIHKLPLVEQEMASLKRNYDQSATAYNSLLQKRLAAGIATDMERSQKSERFKVVDPARLPRVPVKPKRIVFLLAGSVVALLLAAAIAIALHLRQQVFLGEWELPPGTPVLGRVPFISPALERTP